MSVAILFLIELPKWGSIRCKHNIRSQMKDVSFCPGKLFSCKSKRIRLYLRPVLLPTKWWSLVINGSHDCSTFFPHWCWLYPLWDTIGDGHLGFTAARGQDWHKSLASKQHQYQNTCQQHHTVSHPGPVLLILSVGMGTAVSNKARPLAIR